MNSKGLEIPRPQSSQGENYNWPVPKTKSGVERPQSKEGPFRVRPITAAPPKEKKRTDLEIILSENIDENELCRILNVSEEELVSVSRFELKIDLQFSSLQLTGDLLPNLIELKLNNSRISTLRDIGTSCQNIKTLWVNSCGIQSLSGMNAFPKLMELFASYNEIIDISDIAFHEGISVLDLEGNEISDIMALSMAPNLKNVTLAGNPISGNRDYYEIVKENVPGLESLDEGIDIDLHLDTENYSLMKKSLRKAFETTKKSNFNIELEEKAEDNGYSDLLFNNDNAFCANACKLLKGKKRGTNSEIPRDYTREELVLQEEKYFSEFFEQELKRQKIKAEESKAIVFDDEGNFEIYELDSDEALSEQDFSEKEKPQPKREISTANSDLRGSNVRRPSLQESQENNYSRIINDSSELSGLDLEKSSLLQGNGSKLPLGRLKIGKFHAVGKLNKVPLSQSSLVEGNEEMKIKKLALAKKLSEKGGLRHMRLVKNEGGSLVNGIQKAIQEQGQPITDKPPIHKIFKLGSEKSKGLLPHLTKSSISHEGEEKLLPNSFSKKRILLKKPLIKKVEDLNGSKES